MNLQEPRAFTRREKAHKSKLRIDPSESAGLKPIEVRVERLITILSSFEESTIDSSNAFSIGSSFSEDSYESLGVITQLEDFIVREIGNVLDGSMDNDDDYSQTGYWTRAAFSQDFSVLPSKHKIVKSEEWKRKTGGTVEEILACSTNDSFSLVPVDIPLVQNRRKKELDQENKKEAVISKKPLPQSAQNGKSKVKNNKDCCQQKDFLKEIQTNNLLTTDIRYKLTSASCGGQNRCIESQGVRKSQSNVSQSVRKKSDTTGLSNFFQDNMTFHGPGHDDQTDNSVNSVALESEMNRNPAREFHVDENLKETTDHQHYAADLSPNETIAENNQEQNIALIAGADSDNPMTSDCQHNRCAEEAGPSCKRLQGHIMKNRRSLKLMTSKFQSIIATLESRKKTSDWKIKLFKGSDRAKRHIDISKSAEEDGDVGPRSVSETNCADNSLPTVPSSVPPNKSLRLGSEKNPNEECPSSNNAEANKNQKAFLVDDNLAIAIPVTPIESLQTSIIDQGSLLELGQEVVGEFERSIVTPKRNLGDLLRRPFRKSQDGTHPEHAYKRETLIEANVEPAAGCQNETNNERKCHENGSSSSNSLGTESTKSLRKSFSGSAKPENHHRSKVISVATKREIQRLISDMASLKNVESSKFALKPLKDIAVRGGTIQEGPNSDNARQKSYTLFGVADDFTNLFSCHCKAQ
ncbi:hypothetical protein FisN_1Hu330 [Fistulifera solaris]|uniref:Uncharacterized protein n=1 Tax=Fistulifera solaris TaxID=1519565 RepID=A0A1Z5J9Z6_FISSO|nr:hypothetical protein FisN_1Hu330 [Fistulifera solaris]|eukprot:GAX10789.1 hypothetical protein FisN_1Hu330 [Fistulifera solaris]